jgi:hypothetical protein
VLYLEGLEPELKREAMRAVRQAEWFARARGSSRANRARYCREIPCVSAVPEYMPSMTSAKSVVMT